MSVVSAFIDKQKALYKSLQPVFCAAIQDTVYFNAEGLKHLLYDNKHRPRNHGERHYKLALVDYLVEVVTNASTATQKTHTSPACSLWILNWHEVSDKNGEKHKVKIILRKMGNGNVHFLSVMQKKVGKPKGTKKPKP
jgi:hypothetical protein